MPYGSPQSPKKVASCPPCPFPGFFLQFDKEHVNLMVKTMNTVACCYVPEMDASDMCMILKEPVIL